jgi:hypothetical protein
LISSVEHSAPARLIPSSSQASVRLVRAAELPAYLEVWQRLSDRALYPNISYEPWMVMPILQTCVTDHLYFLLVFGPQEQELWGFIPLEKQTRCLHLPIPNLVLWQHRFCYVTAPLLHVDHARQTLEALWQWFESNPLGAHVLDTNWLLADGAFHNLWLDFAIGRVSFMLSDLPRALFQPEKPLPAYLAQVISRKSQLEFQRRERRLAELGTLRYETVNAPEEVEAWLMSFLKLEAAGWKGESGGRAFATYPPDASYFCAITKEAYCRGRLLLLSLTLDGKPIAMRHTLFAGEGAFAYRTAYDESYAKYSPGVLLELELMRRICHRPGIKWMDSCASPRHELLNRIWRDRRMIRRSLFSDGSIAGDLLLSLLPLVRWAGKLLRSRTHKLSAN